MKKNIVCGFDKYEELCKLHKTNKYQEYKARARQKAIVWQLDFNNHNYSWGELLEYQTYFEKLGKRYGLLKEFKENCIC